MTFPRRNLHYEKFADGTVECVEDEIPFELPDGWAWSRLGSISSAIQYGLSNSAEQTGVQRLLRITDIQDGKVNWDTVPFTTVQDPEQYLLKKGDIVFARTGATVGKSFLIEETPYPAVYASYLIRIRLLDGVYPEYIYQFFNSQCYWNQITDKSVGVGQPNCNGTSLKELFIPLPPANEQSRIVLASRSALEYVVEIESQKNLLLEDISTIKSKILDLAIRGNLVPQNPNDEPASVLLERIRAEKEELIRQGKIKRDKKESVIFKGEDNSYYEKIGDSIIDITDEIPFKLPVNCLFVRFKDVWELLSGRDLAPGDYNDQGEGTPYITGASNFFNGTVAISRWTTAPQVITKQGDLLITCKGTVGEIALNTFGDAHIARQIMTMRNNYHLNIEYLSLCIKYYIESLKTAAKGLIPGISRDDILNLILPMPSETYQTSVVNRVNELFEIIEHIKKSLS